MGSRARERRALPNVAALLKGSNASLFWTAQFDEGEEGVVVEAVVVLDEVVLLALAGEQQLLAVPLLLLPGFAEEYRSEYHPPPLRMKPEPPETSRFAVAWWHSGQSRSADSVMRCSASQV